MTIANVATKQSAKVSILILFSGRLGNPRLAQKDRAVNPQSPFGAGPRQFKLVLFESSVFVGALYALAQSPLFWCFETDFDSSVCCVASQHGSGFALTYPSSLIAEPLPENGAGRRYHSADHQVWLFVAGNHTFPEESLDNFWHEELNTRDKTVTYKFKKDNYYVVSGVNPNGYEFYHKVFFYRLTGWSSKLLTRTRKRYLRRLGRTYCV
jgi:hypothetical protein